MIPILAMAGLWIAGAGAGQAPLQTSAQPHLTTCKVAVSSVEAGRLEVRKLIQPPRVEAVYPAAGLVFSHWSPPVPGSSLTLSVDYVAHDQDTTAGMTGGVDIEFPAPKGVAEDQLFAELIADGVTPLRIDHIAGVMGTDKYGLVLDRDRPAERAMGRLIGAGARVQVVIFKADWVFQSEMFEGTEMKLKVLGEPKPIISEKIDTTAIAARDKLFVQAKPAVVAQDPKVCSDAQ